MEGGRERGRERRTVRQGSGPQTSCFAPADDDERGQLTLLLSQQHRRAAPATYRVEHLEQRRVRVAVVARVADLVDLVEEHDRVADAGLAQRGDDLARHRADVLLRRYWKSARVGGRAVERERRRGRRDGPCAGARGSRPRPGRRRARCARTCGPWPRRASARCSSCPCRAGRAGGGSARGTARRWSGRRSAAPEPVQERRRSGRRARRRSRSAR